MPRFPRFAAWPVLAHAAVLLAWGTSAWGDTWVDTHDEPAPAWEVDTSQGAQVVGRERVRVAAPRAGVKVGAERIDYLAPPGVPAWAWRTVPPAAVIDELRLALDGRVTLPGASLAAEVVLPRSTDDDGDPIRLRVRSAPATPTPQGDVDLAITELPKLVQREARVWRLAHRGESIDPTGAYVTRVALLLPGAGRRAQVWVRELRVESLVTPLQRGAEGLVAKTAPAASDSDAPLAGGRLRRTEVTLRSDGFRIDGELFYPRVWRWRGEPAPLLAARGINTLWLDHTPTPQQLAEAADHRLRLICPPPASLDEAATPSYERVLAWVLGPDLDAGDLDTGLARVETARGLEAPARRPVLAHVIDAAAEWSRVVDGVIVQPPVSRVADGAARAESASRIYGSVPPGAPVFAVAPLDVDARVADQLDALVGDALAPVWLPPADVAASVDDAILHGACGVVFTADERIDGADDASVAAAGWLEAINRRLRLIEPWLIGPRSARPLAGGAGVLLDRGGVRLAAVAPLAAPNASNLLLPGASGSLRLLRLTPAGLHAWSTQRVTGGTGAPRPAGAAPGDLLVGNDPRIVRSLRKYTASTAPAAAKNAASLAVIALRLTEALPPETRRQAEARLAEARLAASRRDYASAYDAAHGALSLVAFAEAARRDLAQQAAVLESSPLAVLPATLTDHFRMTQLLAASGRGPNRLHGGSFEDIDELRRHGWRHPSTEAAAGARVELIEDDPVHGERVLRLTGDGARILSPEVRTPAGETLEMTGWVRVESSSGRLVVTDSLGGDELALKIGATGEAWKPFRLLRATRVETGVRLTLETRGDVVAAVDGVMVRALQPVGVAGRTPRTASNR